MASSIFPCLERVAPIVEANLGVVGSKADGLAELGDRLVELSSARQVKAQVHARQGVPGVQPDRLAVLGDRAVVFPFPSQGDAQVGAGPRVAWVEPDRLAVLGDRLVVLALGLEGIGEVVMGGSIFGLELDRLAERLGCRAGIVFDLTEQDPQVAPGVDRVGLEANRLAVFGDGVVHPPVAAQGRGQVEVGPRRVPELEGTEVEVGPRLGLPELEGTAVFGDRLADVALLAQRDPQGHVGLRILRAGAGRPRGRRRRPPRRARLAWPGKPRARNDAPRQLRHTTLHGLARASSQNAAIASSVSPSSMSAWDSGCAASGRTTRAIM